MDLAASNPQRSASLTVVMMRTKGQPNFQTKPPIFPRSWLSQTIHFNAETMAKPTAEEVKKLARRLAEVSNQDSLYIVSVKLLGATSSSKLTLLTVLPLGIALAASLDE